MINPLEKRYEEYLHSTDLKLSEIDILTKRSNSSILSEFGFESFHLTLNHIAEAVFKSSEFIDENDNSTPNFIIKALPSLHFNAEIKKFPEGYIILVNDGLIGFCLIFIDTILKSTELQSRLYTSGLERNIEHSQSIEDLARLNFNYVRNGFLKTKEYTEYFDDPINNIDDDLNHLKWKLLFEILSFVIAHELYHMLDGHFYDTSSSQGANSLEFDKSYLTSHQKENRADYLAAFLLFNKERRKRPNSKPLHELDWDFEVKITLSAIIMFFQISGSINLFTYRANELFKIKNNFNSTHPSSISRINTLLNTLVKKGYLHVDNSIWGIPKVISDYVSEIEKPIWNSLETKLNLLKNSAILSESDCELLDSSVKLLMLRTKFEKIAITAGYSVELFSAIILKFNPRFNRPFDIGNAILLAGNYNEALDQYLKAKITGYDNPQLNNLIGYCNYNLNQINESIEYYNKSLSIDPTNIISYFCRGQSNISLSNFDEAIYDFSKTIQLAPYLASAFENRANAYIETKNYKGALSDLSTTILLGNKSELVFYKRGRVYSLIKDFSTAILDFKKAIELNPKYTNAVYYLGFAFSELKEYKKSVSYYSYAIELNQNYSKAFGSRGFSYARLSDHENAILDFTKAINLNPDESFHYLSRALSYKTIKKYFNSIQDFTKVITLNPSDKYAYTSRHEIFTIIGNLEKYNAEIEQIMQIPSLIPFNEGIKFTNLKNYDAALIKFADALMIYPFFGNAYYSMGIVFLTTNKLTSAHKSFTLSIKFISNTSDSYYHRGVTEIKLENIDAAILDFSNAIKLDSQHENAYINRGIAYANKGVFDLAIKDLSVAISINPKNAIVLYTRGKIFEDMGDSDNAKIDFINAYDLDPTLEE